MFRTLKFRAWHTVTKRWTDIQYVASFDGNGMVNTMEGVIVLQFTGRCDKNGVEIFEGDVIKSFGGGVGEIFYDESSAKFKIRWHDKLFKSVRKSEESFFPNLNVVWEVIGNKYEHPKLITDAQAA
jgi:uncharacterized phage protein (TIGR01671 family)